MRNNWIDISDEDDHVLPKKGELVLALDHRKVVYIGSISKGPASRWYTDNGYEMSDIIAWCPIEFPPWLEGWTSVTDDIPEISSLCVVAIDSTDGGYAVWTGSKFLDMSGDTLYNINLWRALSQEEMTEGVCPSEDSDDDCRFTEPF